MSRFVKRSAENEPLMRLERPTLASSQTTAHIINSCFHEVLSQRQQIDSGAINNMAVSRRGDPNLYHDSFVEEAKQVETHSAQYPMSLGVVCRRIVGCTT